MSTEPLGNTFITVTFELDANAEKMMIKNVKQVTKKISKQMKQQISKDVAEGIEQGAGEAEKKIKGRLGFAGGGILGPFRPEVMLAYTGARYMHMFLTRFVFNPIEDIISHYYNRKKMGFETQGVKPTEETLKELQGMRDILPDITAKLGLFLQEITKGTNLDATDIVSELKKMIDQGKAQNVTEAFEKYRSILTMSGFAREKALTDFGGSLSVAENLRYGNVTPNLLNYVNSKEFERYSTVFEDILRNMKDKQLIEYSVKAQAIRDGLTEMVQDDLYKTMEKEIKDLKEANKLALQYPNTFRYNWKHRDVYERPNFPETQEETNKRVQAMIAKNKEQQSTYLGDISSKMFSEMLKYLKELAEFARKSEQRKQFEDNTN
jgi:hypothetical protein